MNYIQAILLISVVFGNAALYASEGDRKKGAHRAHIICSSPSLKEVNGDIHLFPKDPALIERYLNADPDLQNPRLTKLKQTIAIDLAGKVGLQTHIDQYVIELFRNYTQQLQIPELTLYRIALKITDRLLDQIQKPTEKNND